MNKQIITYEAIAEIADRIKARGEKPSIDLISTELGVFEHTAEVGQFLESWYRHQPEFQRNEFMPKFADEAGEPIDKKTVEFIEKNKELKNALSLARATLESTADGILIINKNGEVTDWNQKFSDMWRLPAGLLEAGPEGPGFAYVLDQVEDPEALVKEVTKLYDNPDEQGNLGEVHFKDGRVFERFSQPHRIDGEIVGRVWSFRDVTAQRQNEYKLRLRERAIEASSNGIFMFDLADENKIVYVNSAFERMTGFEEEEILGKNFSILLGKKTNQVPAMRISRAIEKQHSTQAVLQCFRKNGVMFWNEISLAPVKDLKGKISYFVGIMNDITQRRKMEQQLIYQATYDSLTNLPNRSLLVDRLNQEIIHARTQNNTVAVLFLDLDRFKLINDTLGHTLGDKILQMVANRLVKHTRTGDTVARIGGDEFVVLLPSLKNEEEAVPIAKNILSSLDEPFYLNNQNFNITSSIGVSFFPKDGDNFETLLKNADLSMYSAKDSGRNNIKLFTEEMQTKIRSRVKMENELRNVLINDEFEVHYQPVINLSDNSIIGMEALLRWHNEKLGNVSPVEFIPLLEESGMIVDVGKWVLDQSANKIKDWHDRNVKDVRIAVNLSAIQFKKKVVCDCVSSILRETKIKPEMLEVEITESLLIDDVESTIKILNEIKNMGVSIAIDDFGTGYSSLSYLKRFPVDKLKIDRSFINDVTVNENNAAITRAIINLAHSLMLKVVAEGIETDEQRQFLVDHGCDLAQGYFFAKPNKADEIEKLLCKD